MPSLIGMIIGSWVLLYLLTHMFGALFRKCEPKERAIYATGCALVFVGIGAYFGGVGWFGFFIYVAAAIVVGHFYREKLENAWYLDDSEK